MTSGGRCVLPHWQLPQSGLQPTPSRTSLPEPFAFAIAPGCQEHNEAQFTPHSHIFTQMFCVTICIILERLLDRPRQLSHINCTTVHRDPKLLKGHRRRTAGGWKQVRMIAEHHEGRWTERISNWNPAISTKQEGTKNKVGWPRDGKTTTTHTYQPRQPRSHERHDLAHHGTRWIETGLDGQLLYEQQTQETNTTHHTPSPRLR